MQIASWNVNSLRVRLDQVLEWLRGCPVDVLGLQETKIVDSDFPLEQLSSAGYRVVYTGQRSYNGVAIISRHEASDVVKDLPGAEDPQRRFLAASYDGVRVINLYVPNGQVVGSEKFAYKLEWLRHLRAFLEDELRRYPELLVIGDFNIAPEDRDVHDPAAWEGSVLVSEPERKALGAVLELGLEDAFRLFDQPAQTFSWWDYRAAAFRRNRGLRIDLILASAVLAKHCVSSRIDSQPRGWPRPSDHAPVLAEFQI